MTLLQNEHFVPTAPAVKHFFSRVKFPLDWITPHLDSCIAESAPICYGILMPGGHVRDGVPVIKVKDFAAGVLVSDELLRTSPEIDQQYRRSRVRAGDILLSIRGSTGEVAIVPKEWDGANITQDTARLRVNAGVDRDFVFHAIQGSFVQKQIQLETVGQAVKGINIGSVRLLVVPIPPEGEQRKIALILETNDCARAQLERLILVKGSRKRGLRQQLLTGKMRFKAFKGEKWQKLPAGKLFQNRSQRNDCGAPVLSVTQDQGIVLRASLDRRISGDEENHPNYKLVLPGDFVISLRSFQGGLEYSSLKGAVSPAYHVITPTIPACADFYRHFFKSYEFIERLAMTVIGIRDGKQVSFGDFEFLKLPYPPLGEQKRIAAVLNTCDEEIKLLEKQHEALKEQKRGLMQKLLTGEVRVKLNKD